MYAILVILVASSNYMGFCLVYLLLITAGRK